MIPEMLELWRRLEAADANLRFLLLANEAPVRQHRAQHRDQSVLPNKLNVQSVPRTDVPDYLAAADIGFMLREQHKLNAVASPVKFGEYLASGLALVTSPGLGDVDAAVTQHDLGVLVDPRKLDEAEAACLELVARVRRDRVTVRERAQSFATSYLDWRAYLGAWCGLIGKPS
jgi:hypothetical protein